MCGTKSYGCIEVIVGPMYSGKSEELIRRVRRANIAKQKVQVFKHSVDDRYSKADVVSHCGNKVEAIPVKDTAELLGKLEKDTKVVAIDEVQFFENEITHTIEDLAERGMRVICAGLDMDFRGEPFGPIPRLVAVAEKVDKINAICLVCGNPATRTQRLINGKPAKYSDPIVLVGAQDSYEARCRNCHIIIK